LPLAPAPIMSLRRFIVASLVVGAIALAVIVATCAHAQPGRRDPPGSWTSYDKEPDHVVHDAMRAVTREVIESLAAGPGNHQIDDISIVSYRTQLVAGRKFRVQCEGLRGGTRVVEFQAEVFRSLPRGGKPNYSLLSVTPVEKDL
jgi:hypothetical protein